jgi:hypothetical protein
MVAALSAAVLVNGAALAAGPLTNFGGIWWNPDESGWGLAIDQQGDVIFGAVVAYDSVGDPSWVVMSRMDKEPLNPFRGPVDNYEGTVYRAGAVDRDRSSMFSAEVDVADVGDAVLAFQNEMGNQLVYTVGDVQVRKEITPLVFNGAAAVCGGDAMPGDAPNYQGMWGNAPLLSERWGLYLAQQGEVIFGLTLGYDGAGKATWNSMQLSKAESGAYSGPVIRTTGPSYDTKFDPAAVTRTVVGSASLSFSDAENGVFESTLNEVAQPTKNITRMLFSETRTVCR